MKRVQKDELLKAELKGEVDFYLGVSQNPNPAGSIEGSAWLDGQCVAWMCSDETYKEWEEAHAKGFPKEEVGRALTILSFQKNGKGELLRSLWALERPWTTGRYTFQFRLENGRFSQPFAVEIYRHSRKLKVRHALPAAEAPFCSPFDLDCILFDNVLWKSAPEGEEV